MRHDEHDSAIPIEAVTATDTNYLPFLAAMATSLASSRANWTPMRLTVLHQGVPGGEQERIARTTSGLELRWQEVTADAYRRLGLPVDPLILAPAYFRCLVPHLLPDSATRALYLDADTIVLRDLLDLWRVDLGAAPVAAVQDWLPTVRSAVAPWRQLGLNGDAPYFNSGVMVVDLDSWRRTGAGLAALRRCLTDRQHLAAQGRWPQHDQYGLNVVFHERWLGLSNTWNYYSELPFARPHVVHFVGGGKPGSPTCHPQFTDAFTAAVDATAWAGWRPQPEANALTQIGGTAHGRV